MSNKPKYVNQNGTHTKVDIILSVYNSIGYSKKFSAQLVDFCFDTIKEQLANNKNVKISSFGHFMLRDKNERIGRNPTTGDNIVISSRRVVTFRPSVFLKDKVQ